jgi:hypothetical protein
MLTRGDKPCHLRAGVWALTCASSTAATHTPAAGISSPLSVTTAAVSQSRHSNW